MYWAGVVCSRIDRKRDTSGKGAPGSGQRTTTVKTGLHGAMPTRDGQIQSVL